MGSLIGIIDSSSPEGLSDKFMHDQVCSFADLFSATLIDREEDCADSSKSAGGASPVFQTTQNYPTQTKHVDEDSRGNFTRDIEYYLKRLCIAREAGDRAAEGRAYYDLGIINFTRDIPEALKCFETSLFLAREAGDRAGETAAHFGIGIVYFKRSDFEKAVKCFEDSSKIAREAGDQAGVRRASHSITECYLGLGNSVKGTDYREKYSQFFRGMGAHSEKRAEGPGYSIQGNFYRTFYEFQKQ